jgi:hypothetical protein
MWWAVGAAHYLSCRGAPGPPAPCAAPGGPTAQTAAMAAEGHAHARHGGVDTITQAGISRTVGQATSRTCEGSAEGQSSMQSGATGNPGEAGGGPSSTNASPSAASADGVCVCDGPELPQRLPATRQKWYEPVTKLCSPHRHEGQRCYRLSS